MSKQITIQHSHNLGRQEARRRAEQLRANVQQKWKVGSTWGRFIGAFAGKIEAGIRKEMETILA